jgi:hypothetical protein
MTTKRRRSRRPGRWLDWAFAVWEAPSWAAGAGVHEPFPQREAPGELQQLGSGPPKTDEARRELLTALGVLGVAEPPV